MSAGQPKIGHFHNEQAKAKQQHDRGRQQGGADEGHRAVIGFPRILNARFATVDGWSVAPELCPLTRHRVIRRRRPLAAGGVAAREWPAAPPTYGWARQAAAGLAGCRNVPLRP